MDPERAWAGLERFLDSPAAYVTFVGLAAAVALVAVHTDSEGLAALAGLFALIFVTDLFTLRIWDRVESRFERVERDRTPPDRELTPPRVSPTTKTVIVVGTALLVLYVLIGLGIGAAI